MKFILHKNCSTCPEQYDVYHDGKQVGYLRLRHGTFRVDCPYGNTLYDAQTVGNGEFFNENERSEFIGKALLVIQGQLTGGINPGVSYTIVDQASKPKETK